MENIPMPIRRTEQYLSFLTGNTDHYPEDPITREEKYLYYLCKNGAGGGGVTPEQIQAAVEKYLSENPIQPGATPEQAEQIEKNTENISKKLDKNQGAENKGKILEINESGDLVPASKPSADTNKIDHGTSDTTFELTPNIKHKWGKVASLTLTLAAGKAGIVNEYMFSFISGDTATQVSVRTSDGELVKGLPAIEPNSLYEMSIEDDCLAYGRWDNNVTV